MKKCHFCAEEIQEKAVKCRYCGEFLIKKPETKWYFNPTWLVVLFLCVGPLMLPLVWVHPRYSPAKRTVVSAVVIAATLLLGFAAAVALKTISMYYGQMFPGGN